MGDSDHTEWHLRRYLESATEADRELLGRLEKPLMAYITRHPVYRALSRWMTAEDVLQELWLKMIRRRALERFEDRGLGSLRAYVKQYADGILRDLLRRHATVKRGGRETLEPLTSRKIGRLRDDFLGPSTAIGNAEFLAHCRSRLPDNQAAVWRLHVEEGLSIAESANRLKCSESSVRGRMFRAIRELIRLQFLAPMHEHPDANPSPDDD